MNGKLVLDFDPFEGDFGSPFDKRLKDKIVTNRKDHSCTYCGGKSFHGDKSRVIVEIFEGEFQYYRYCQKCCIAMEQWEKHNNYKPWEYRQGLYL